MLVSPWVLLGVLALLILGATVAMARSDWLGTCVWGGLALALVDKLTRRIVSLSRMLHVHPEATQGRAQDQGNKLELEREAEQEADPLIPTLYAVK